MFLAILFTLLGIILLSLGAHFFVEGSLQFAKRLKLSPLFIGLTVAAIGTSSPELFFSAWGSAIGQGEIVLGNIVGSNLFNTLAILGISSLCTPLFVKKKILRWDIPFGIFTTLFFIFFAYQGVIVWWEGLLLMGAFIAHTYYALKQENGDFPPSSSSLSPLWIGGYLLLGTLILLVGSELLIQGVNLLGQTLKINPLLLSLIIVSIGTSLPELAITFAAIRKNEAELAIGNVLGSNLFNLLVAGGIGALFSPEGLIIPHSLLTFDLPILLGASIFLFPMALTGEHLVRWEGALLIFYYIFYCFWVIIRALYAPWEPLLLQALVYFLIPLTTLAISVSLVRHYRRGV
jgi:cation:H+ antiporter